MNVFPKDTNQGEKLKEKRPNYLTPPYRKPTPQEQQRYEQSNQLSILPILQPIPQQLIQHQPQQVQKPKQKVGTKVIPNKSTQHKRDIQKEKEEMLKWLNSVEIS